MVKHFFLVSPEIFGSHRFPSKRHHLSRERRPNCPFPPFTGSITVSLPPGKKEKGNSLWNFQLICEVPGRHQLQNPLWFFRPQSKIATWMTGGIHVWRTGGNCFFEDIAQILHDVMIFARYFLFISMWSYLKIQPLQVKEMCLERWISPPHSRRQTKYKH